MILEIPVDDIGVKAYFDEYGNMNHREKERRDGSQASRRRHRSVPTAAQSILADIYRENFYEGIPADGRLHIRK
jgi:hypothetical protein